MDKSDPNEFVARILISYRNEGGETIADNIKEYARVLKTGEFLIARVPDSQSYFFDKSCKLLEGNSKLALTLAVIVLVTGYIALKQSAKSKIVLHHYFANFSFGRARNDYFGIDARIFWVVAKNNNH